MCFVLTTTDAWVPRPRKERERRGPEAASSSGIQRTGSSRSSPTASSAERRLWVGEARVPMSDLERTLLDCLSMPRHCGGIGEALYAFQVAMPRLNIERITEYAIRLGVTTAKRLGWALEAQGVHPFELEELAALPIKGYRKLDPTGPRKGPCNGRWMVQENLPRMVEA